MDYGLAVTRLGKAANGLPPYDLVAAPKPVHSIVYPALMSAAVGKFGSSGGRVVSLIVGLIGLVGLFLLLRQIAGDIRPAFCFTLLTAMIFPVLPYLSLALPEIVLFCGVAWVLYLLGRPKVFFSLIALLLVVMTFFHLRALGLIFGVFLLLLARQVSESGYQPQWAVWRNFVSFILTLLIGLTLFSIFSLSVYGSLLGAVSTARPIFSTSGLASALIGARHGLFTYAPIWMMSIVGLILGCRRGDRWAIRAIVLLIFMVIGFIGPDAGECWPARFWVMTTPALIIGLLLAWRYSSGPGRIVFSMLLIISLINTLTYVIYPGMYLESRQISRVYEFWHEKIPTFHFGIPLIVSEQPWHGQILLVLILVGIATLAITQIRRYMRWVLATLFLIIFLGTVWVEPVNTEISDKGNNRVAIRFKDAQKVDGNFLLEIYQPWLCFLPPASLRINDVLIPAAPALLLDMHECPALNLVLPPEISNQRQPAIVLIRARAPWVRWLGLGNRV
jgi:hypothetical protein